MADYTEKASLMIVDGSSAKINKINQALSRLFTTANRAQSALNKLGSGNAAARINATAKAVNALARASAKLPKNTSLGVKLRGNSAADLRSMAKAMSQYKSASKNINTLIGAGGRAGSNYKNLDELTNKLVRVARAANMAANALGRAKANIPGRGGFGVPNGGGRGGNNMIPRSIGLEIQPLKSFWRSAVVSLGHTITNAIRDGFAEGIKGFDVAENKLNQQRIFGPDRERLRQQAFAGEQRAPIWRADERLDFYAEVGSNFRNPTDAAGFDKYVERAIYTAVQQGGDREEATKGVAQLFKGLGNAGYLIGQDGGVNPDIGKYIEAYTAAKTSEGAQINFNDAAQVLKYARTSAQSLTPKEFFLQLIAAADIGASTQGVQLNQTMKNFAGETTKKALKAQEEGGIRAEGQMVLSGQVGNRKTYTYEAGAIKDEELLRENPSEWFAKNIFGKGGFLEKQGLNADTSTPAQIISALDPLAGNRNVDDYVAKTVLQYQERLTKAARFYDKPQTDEEMARTNMTSSWVQLQETTQQLISLFGNLGSKLEQTFIPVIDTVGNWAQRLNNVIEGKTPAQMQDYALLGGAGAAGIAGGAIGVKILAWAATGFGLPAAATALTKSAAELSLAARALAGGSAVPDGVGSAGKSKAWWLTLLGGVGANVAAGVVQSGSVADNPYLNAEADERQAMRDKARAQYELQSRSPQLTEDATELGKWIAKLTEARTRYQYAQEQGLTPSSDYYQKAEIDFQTANDNVTRLQTSLTEGSAAILSAFETGSTRIEGASAAFGSSAADTLLGVASQFGSAAGAAMREAIGVIGVNVKTPDAGPNTGTNTNLQTGG